MKKSAWAKIMTEHAAHYFGEMVVVSVFAVGIAAFFGHFLGENAGVASFVTYLMASVPPGCTGMACGDECPHAV